MCGRVPAPVGPPFPSARAAAPAPGSPADHARGPLWPRPLRRAARSPRGSLSSACPRSRSARRPRPHIPESQSGAGARLVAPMVEVLGPDWARRCCGRVHRGGYGSGAGNSEAGRGPAWLRRGGTVGAGRGARGRPRLGQLSAQARPTSRRAPHPVPGRVRIRSPALVRGAGAGVQGPWGPQDRRPRSAVTVLGRRPGLQW